MGLGGCYAVLKYLLVIFNLIFWVLGIAGVVFSVWMLFDPTFSFSLTQESHDYVVSVVIILLASILLLIVAGFGIYGALKESQCALITFFSLLLIIFVAEISATLWVYINRNSLELQVKNAVKLTVEQEYHQNDNRKLLFDTFQKNLHCCGSEAPTDWLAINHVDISVRTEAKVGRIPASCCREGVSMTECTAATVGVKPTTLDFKVIYDKGCYTLIISKLKEHSCWLLGIGIAISIIQCLGLIFALILAFAVNKSNRYKA